MARQGGASGEEAPPQEQSFFEFLARMCKNEPRKEKVTFVAGKGATGKILGIPEPIASKGAGGGVHSTFGRGTTEAPKEGIVFRRSQGAEKVAQDYRQTILENERLAQSLKEKEAKLHQLVSWYGDKVKEAEQLGSSLPQEMQKGYTMNRQKLSMDISAMRTMISNKGLDAEAAKKSMRSGSTAIFHSSLKNLSQTSGLVKSASLRARRASAISITGGDGELTSPLASPLASGGPPTSPTRVSRRGSVINMGGSSRNLLSSPSKEDEKKLFPGESSNNLIENLIDKVKASTARMPVQTFQGLTQASDTQDDKMTFRGGDHLV